MTTFGPVHRPEDDATLATLVRDAAAAGTALRIRGAGTWMDAGHPVRADATVDVGALSGITAYAPDDLTLSCGAGTTLAELDAATRAHGQWCPLLPWGGDAGTVGATIATATAGPFAERLGRPRQLVLGVRAVDGRGRVIDAGGRVVKNVAGFDLTRALTGSWGTLAVLTHLHLRLRARPAVDETWFVAGASDDAMAAFSRGPEAPLAVWPIGADEAPALDLPAPGWLLRIGGNAPAVAAARAALRALGSAEAVDPARWDAVRRGGGPPARATAWRWDPLARALRQRFDPARILNPGLLGDPA